MSNVLKMYLEKYGLEKVGGEVVEPSASFLDALPEDGKQLLQDAIEACRSGEFPDIWDFSPTFGRDISAFANVDDGVYVLANDGAGNYFVLYPNGFVDVWCHDEEGYMQGFDFPSLASCLECVVLTTVVKRKEGRLGRGLFALFGPSEKVLGMGVLLRGTRRVR